MSWVYYKENIGTDNIVASFTNNNGYHICDIYEGGNGYNPNTCVKGIHLSCVEYGKARSMNSVEEEQGASIEVLFARLKHACELFEEDYLKQVAELKNIFGF